MRQDNGERCENCDCWKSDYDKPDGYKDEVTGLFVIQTFDGRCLIDQNYNSKQWVDWCGEWKHDGVTWNDKLTEPEKCEHEWCAANALLGFVVGSKCHELRFDDD